MVQCGAVLCAAVLCTKVDRCAVLNYAMWCSAVTSHPSEKNLFSSAVLAEMTKPITLPLLPSFLTVGSFAGNSIAVESGTHY